MTAQVAEAVLPRVSGRHRDRALASACKCRAIQLKLQGLTYQQIADELGYNSRGTVYKIIKTAQAARLTGAVEEHLDIEVSRLNALQAAVWPAAMSGDLRALVVAARIIDARCRLLGLIGPATKRTACQQPQTLVTRDDDCRLRGCPAVQQLAISQGLARSVAPMRAR